MSQYDTEERGRVSRDIPDEPEEMEVESTSISPIDIIAASEFERALEYARKHPRKLSVWKRRALEFVTLDEFVAGKCFYALPRKEKNRDTGNYETKMIQGPSARFAEIIVSTWGNCKAGARVAGEDPSGEFIRAQGTFVDLETNFSCGFEVTRRITTSSGDKFKADMIQVTGNAAASIAYRNAALKGIPGALWNPIFEAAKRAAVGDIKSLKKKREEVLALFNKMGIPTETIFVVAAIKGIDDIDGDVLVFLKGLENAIRDNDTDVETILGQWSKTKPQDASPGIFRSRSAVQEAVDRAKNAGGQPAQPPPQGEAAGPQNGGPEPARAATSESAEQTSPPVSQPGPQSTADPVTAGPPATHGNGGTLFSGPPDKGKTEHKTAKK